MDKIIPFKGCLFDLDGTLIDSLPAVNRVWTILCQKYNLNTDYVLSVIHGRPAEDSIRQFLSDQGPEYIEQEIRWLEDKEATDTEGVVAIDGSIHFLEKLNQHKLPWAIVTSGTYPVATARIKAAGIPSPPILITAENITKGKPDPEPYLLGAEKIGVGIKDCIVFEDAPAGIQAGITAEAHVIAISSDHTSDEFSIDRIKNLSAATIDISQGTQELIIRHMN